MSGLKWLGLIPLFIFSGLADAQIPPSLPSGSISSLLVLAEEGDRSALYPVVLGAEQVFPDGSIDQRHECESRAANRRLK